MRNFTLNGQLIAFDAASQTWREYDAATQTFGAVAATPVAGTTFNPDLAAPTPSLVLNNAQPNQQSGSQGQRQQRPANNNEPAMTPFQYCMAGLAVAAVLILCVFVYQQQQANPVPAPVATNQPGVGGAPVVGSSLPKNMIPGNWYATGVTKVVPTGTAVDTNPKDCTRDGVRGECALRKRGT